MKFIDIAIKDLKQGFRSWVALGFMFGAPILMTAMFFFLFGGLGGGEEDSGFQIPVTAVQMVNLDKGELKLGDILVTALQGEGFSDFLEVTVSDDSDAAREAVDAQEAAVAVIIPENFSDSMMEAGRKTDVELYKDPTLILGPNIVTSVVHGFTDNFSGSKITMGVVTEQFSKTDVVLAEEEINFLINEYIQATIDMSGGELLVVESTTGETSQTGSTVAMVSMIMGAMMIFYSFYTGISNLQGILREEENGTMPRLFTTPTPQSTILAGKFLATGIMVFVQIVVLLTFGNLVFGVEWGDLFLLSMVTLGITVTSSTFGIFLISFITKSSQAGAIIGGGLTVTGMIGMIPVFTMSVPNAPKSVEVISKLVPQGWAVDALQTVMEGGSSQNVLISVGVLLVWGAVFFMIGNSRFKRRYV